MEANVLATEYAKYHGIEAQRKSESDIAFRGRVSGALRDAGHLIEAHEAYQDARYEESANVMTVITGALAQALQGVDYGSTGERQIGDDLAAGYVIQNPRPRMSPEEVLLMIALFGGK